MRLFVGLFTLDIYIYNPYIESMDVDGSSIYNHAKTRKYLQGQQQL